MTDITTEMRGVRFSNMLVHGISRETNSLPCCFCLPENFYFHWCQFHKAGLALETKKKKKPCMELSSSEDVHSFHCGPWFDFQWASFKETNVLVIPDKKISMIVFACLRKTCQAENTTGYCKHGTI